MNIFFLHHDPITCAQMHCNKHVVKMIVETAQLLATAHYAKNSATVDMPMPTHTSHPCAVWARESSANYRWLYDLFCALMDEYKYRYLRSHAYERLRSTLCMVPKGMTDKGFTPPAQAMPEEYKSRDVVQAYRTYYLKDKAKMLLYGRRIPPYWIEEPEHANT